MEPTATSLRPRAVAVHVRVTLLRRAQSDVSLLDREAGAEPQAEQPERAAPPRAERGGLDGLRAEMQRRLAAQIDLGGPDPAPAEPVAPPRVERRRLDTLRAEVRRHSTTPVEHRRPGLFSGSLRGRWRFNRSRLLLLAVALLAGGVAAYLATGHEQPAVQPVARPGDNAPVREARTQILVAKAAIGVGERLSPASIAWEDWPQDAVRPEYLTAAASPAALTDMAGSIARFEFFPGEPIRKEKLALPGQGYLSAVLASGKRGVSVAIGAEAASGGFVVPNDHVDVLVTRATGAGTVSDTILHDVRVLAINTRLGETGATGAPADPADPRAEVFKDQAIATLELDPKQAEVISGAGATGKLTLVLRALTDAGKPEDSTHLATNEQIRLTSPFWTTGSGSAAQGPH